MAWIGDPSASNHILHPGPRAGVPLLLLWGKKKPDPGSSPGVTNGAGQPLSRHRLVAVVLQLQRHHRAIDLATLGEAEVRLAPDLAEAELGQHAPRGGIVEVVARLDPARTEGRIDVDTASYFLSKLELVTGDEPTMSPWRKRLFIATSYITADAAAYFKLPLDRTVIIGSRIEV